MEHLEFLLVIGHLVLQLTSLMLHSLLMMMVSYSIGSSKKPTDSRLYLRSNSFHPSHVFDSVAFSQIKRVMRRNSTPEFAEEDVSDLIEDLVKCGYQREKLINLVAKLSREDGTGNTKSMSSVNIYPGDSIFQRNR